GAVVIVPPQGYCIQRETLRGGGAGGFALLASCESLTGYISGYDVEPMVLTVTAVPRRSGAPEPDAEEIASALGDRKVMRRVHGDGLTIVQVMAPEGLTTEDDPRHWRAMMVLNGKMVGLALYGPRGGAVSGEKGLTMLSSQAESLREESPQMAPVSGPVGVLAARPVIRPGRDAAKPVLRAEPEGPAPTGLAVIRPVARPGSTSPEGMDAADSDRTRKRAGLKKVFAGLFNAFPGGIRNQEQ
ncbi:MAG: hypothetical protein R3256_11455, partial [Thalassovita sp.]|nr:hypothetical protein [Thalassovita sp.]